jgi:hypothetical protein
MFPVTPRPGQFTDIADKYTSDTGPFHGMEVFHNALLRDVIVNPVPISTNADTVRRGDKTAFQG